MTYCVGLHLDEGLVLLSDTRTNAGVDHISTFSKMHVIAEPGERVIVMMSAGNLALTQTVVNLVFEGFDSETLGKGATLSEVPTMFKAAQLTGEVIRSVYHRDGEAMKAQSVPFDLSILLAGQIAGRRMRLFQLYSAGNFIEATADTPFLQVGEHKYGKPILDRSVTAETSLSDGVKLALISMDSTLRSNLTVGLPVDLLVYRRDSLEVGLQQRLTEENEYFRLIRENWSEALKSAYKSIPAPPWF